MRAPHARALAILTIAMVVTLGAPTSWNEADAKTRVGDLGRLMGVRSNPLVGYGLVIGLDGTGDRSGTGFTEQSMASLLEELGITLAPSELKLRNVAAALVTAELPAFTREGSRLDVTVSSIGSASDLRGGILVQTPLRGADGQTYVVAQGAISLGGFEASGAGASVQKNHVTVARIPAGGVVEREVTSDVFERDVLDIVLDRPDFETAMNVARAIDVVFGAGTAEARDAGTVIVPWEKVPSELGAVGFAARVENLAIEVQRPSRVVVNERTGTIVAGGDVRIAPVAIAHGGLTIEIRTRATISQPGPFSPGGETVVVPESDLRVTEEGSMMSVPETTSLTEFADALNSLGVSPGDVIAILQALAQVGALDAELVVI